MVSDDSYGSSKSSTKLEYKHLHIYDRISLFINACTVCLYVDSKRRAPTNHDRKKDSSNVERKAKNLNCINIISTSTTKVSCQKFAVNLPLLP